MSARILIVDDEYEIREVVAEFLDGLGYEVVAVGSGREAMDLIHKGPAPFDLALIDWQMPGISGRDVILELGRRGLTDTVLIITGMTNENLGRSTPHLRTGLMHKPFSLVELRDRIQALLPP